MPSLIYFIRNHNFIVNFRDKFFYYMLQNYLKGCNSVLDVGCGESSPLGKIRKTFKSEGVDIFNPSISKSKKNRIHDKYVNSDIRKINKIYSPNSFDAVIALDVIEHFDKKNGNKLIRKMEKIARKRIILLTPNGFYSQDEIGGNPYQRHYSGWSTNDLKELGYNVFGLRGLKYLRGDYASIKYRPWIIWGTVSYLSEILFHFFPQLSYSLIAIKNKKINAS